MKTFKFLPLVLVLISSISLKAQENLDLYEMTHHDYSIKPWDPAVASITEIDYTYTYDDDTETKPDTMITINGEKKGFTINDIKISTLQNGVIVTNGGKESQYKEYTKFNEKGLIVNKATIYEGALAEMLTSINEYQYNDFGLLTSVKSKKCEKCESTNPITALYNADGQLNKMTMILMGMGEMIFEQRPSAGKLIYDMKLKLSAAITVLAKDADDKKMYIEVTTSGENTKYEVYQGKGKSKPAIISSKTRNGQGKLVQKISYYNGDMIANETYTYDATGKPLNIKNVPDDTELTYQYDANGRLISEPADGGFGTNKYTYDTKGNWVKKTKMQDESIESLTIRKIKYVK